MRGYLSICLSILLVPLLATAETTRLEVPGIVGSDERQIEDTSLPPWRAIGRLNITTGGFCTASVIGPRRILTAAHCLWNPRAGRWYPPCALHFLAGYQRGSYAVHALVADIRIAGGWRADRPRLVDDWAILTLDREVSGITGQLPLADSLPAAGSRLTQAGYSRDRRHVLTSDRVCRVSGTAADGRLLLHDCDATLGDSGSPLLTGQGQDREIAAIHVATRRLGGIFQGIAVSVAAARDWLHGHPTTHPPGGVEACQSPDNEPLGRLAGGPGTVSRP